MANTNQTVSATPRPLWRRLLLLVPWLIAAGWLAAHHAMWRDEVRALTLALSGDNVLAMVRLLGDGHPAVWYLLLRAAHNVTATPLVLPVLAGLIGTAAAILFVTRAPLGLCWLVLILFGRFFLYEYTVMARNYGVSMLTLFCLAALWQRGYRGIGLGLLLLVLANCNVHSVILAASFLLFWMVETGTSDGVRWTPGWRRWLASAALVALGVLLCVKTIYPTYDDAAVIEHGPLVAGLARALLLPALQLRALFPQALLAHMPAPLWQIAGSVFLFGGLLAFVRRPSLFVAGLAAMLLLSLVFRLVYPGDYRHAALLLVFLAVLLWLDRSAPAAGVPKSRLWRLAGRLQPAGTVLLASLFALQWYGSGEFLLNTIRDRPESRSADFGAWVNRHPAFARSWIIADPDTFLEPLPYYIANPLWRMRDQQPGPFANHSWNTRLHLTPDDILAAARSLPASGGPVLILVKTHLEPLRSQQVHESYVWTLDVTPESSERFLKSTIRLARFAPASGDESFDVYRLADGAK